MERKQQAGDIIRFGNGKNFYRKGFGPEGIDGAQSKEKIVPVYTALFVDDIPSLVLQFPPKHPRVFAHHSTIAFKPGSLAGINVGEKHAIKVVARVFDEKGNALLVENPKSTNPFPHITLSCAEGVSPVYSNDLLKKAAADGSIGYFKTPIEIAVTEGYFDGKKDCTSP